MLLVTIPEGVRVRVRVRASVRVRVRDRATARARLGANRKNRMLFTCMKVITSL